jgi:CTP synthase
MKYIFITGGVVSSLGKGLTSAALGALLEARGLKVCLQKLDPYLNVDPGTMNPFQHGEVYVLDDGAETDLDLGHYERFTNSKLTALNSVSSGQIYETVLKKERRGDYLGETVQVIPHITNEVKNRVKKVAEDVDIVITELGGTVGDIEGLPFLEGLRQFALELGKENVLFIHVTLLPYLKAAGEMKTKPSQQSVAKMREIGIQPDILVCRTEQPMTKEMYGKLSLFCNVPLNAVIEERDVTTSIYELPINLHNEKLDELVVQRLGLGGHSADMKVWEDVVQRLQNPEMELNIAVVGKYIELQDAYKSVYEALIHAGIANNCRINNIPIDAEKIETLDFEERAKIIHAIVVPGGFGDRGTNGMIIAAKCAREHKIPYFGLCLGMQIAVIEFAQNVLDIKDANSIEFVSDCKDPVINIMDDQKNIETKGGTMRLGLFECALKENSRARNAYGTATTNERHRHRYEYNNKYRKNLESKGLKCVGFNDKRNLVEIVELNDHPWFIGVQFHPEFKSKPHKPHPLFVDFIRAAKNRA